MNVISFILGIFFLITAVIALTIRLSARRINIGDKIFSYNFTLLSKAKEKIKGNRKKKKQTLPSTISPEMSRERSKQRSDKIEDLLDEADSLKEEEISIDLTDEKEKITDEKLKSVFTRDVNIRIPKNMVVDDFYKLTVILSETDLYSPDVKVEHIKVSKEEAKNFALINSRLGINLMEATTKVEGLKAGPLIIRPIAVGNFARISPLERIINFDPNLKEIYISFYITPTIWKNKSTNIICIEIEQDYTILKEINMPVNVFKNTYEAIFGLNISSVHMTVMLVYSLIGSLIGLYGTLSNFLTFLPNLPF